MNTWFKDIERARTEAEVVASARDYCSLLHPRELDALPQECREIRIEASTDIPRLREQLTHGYDRVRDTDAETARLRLLVDFMARASDRIGELRASR
jgi:hypothetical protein